MKNRKHSPMSSTARLSDHSTIASCYKNTFEDHAKFDRNSSAAQFSVRSDNSRVPRQRKASRTPTKRKASRTPTKRGTSGNAVVPKLNYNKSHHGSMHYDPLPTPPSFNQGLEKSGSRTHQYNTMETGQF